MLGVRTARYLQFRQLLHFVYRSLFPISRIRIRDFAPSLRPRVSIESPCSVQGIYVDSTTFCFLNETVNLANRAHALDWLAPDRSRLWRYNLHYFDYLRESARPTSEKDELISSWIKHNPQGSRPGWEPFPTSLRIVNWIYFFWSSEPGALAADSIRSLYNQALWLEKNLERHILANHYFENLKALMFAGCFFQGDDAARWIACTQRKIAVQVELQFLDDGCHYEKSPQYHCLMLENLLDLYGLTRAFPKTLSEGFAAKLESVCLAAFEWLGSMLLPDGSIPLFNDSAHGIAIDPEQLYAYARRLGLAVDYPVTQAFEIIERPESGYYGCRNANDMFVIDCGDIGPSYQPGHTHCDFLSYELVLGNHLIIVDSGVCEYEVGYYREYVRSTKAHNTVSVDGMEQSEIWGSFRVGRRAKRLHSHINRSQNMVNFSGSFRGFHTIPGMIVHRRDASIQFDEQLNSLTCLAIQDTIEGSNWHRADSFVHLAPTVHIAEVTDQMVSLFRDGRKIAEIEVQGNARIRVDSGHYCPEFGKHIVNDVLIIRAEGNLPLSMGYRINVCRT